MQQTENRVGESDLGRPDFYRRTLEILNEAEVPFLVGGAFAFASYTDVKRDTKDFDLFVRERDIPAALEAVHRAGFLTEITHPHWLAKVFHEDESVDLIYRSGNGLSEVDNLWFARAVPGRALGMDILLCPVEETIWTKAFIMERERFDGADVMHLIRSCAAGLDWERLVHLFGDHWRVLLAHITLFGFVYPSHRNLIPSRTMQLLLRRLEHESSAEPSDERICRGTLLSRAQYRKDIDEWGYRDARLRPDGTMTSEEIQQWTDAIEGEAIRNERRRPFTGHR
ncbi:MAG TPA: nucleotidyltransferase [Rhodothermales bacterium]